MREVIAAINQQAIAVIMAHLFTGTFRVISHKFKQRNGYAISLFELMQSAIT